MNYYAIERSTSLSHHGILGQKWGIRRFQNKDGSLTSAGKTRYKTGNKNENPSTADRPVGKENIDNALKSYGFKRVEEFDKYFSGSEPDYKGTFEITAKTITGDPVDLISDYDSREESVIDFVTRHENALKTYNKNEVSIKNQIGDEIYDRRGESWKYSRNISKSEFLKNLKVGSISTTKDWPSQVIMEDHSGLFGGHFVTFEMDDKGKARHIALEG